MGEGSGTSFVRGQDRKGLKMKGKIERSLPFRVARISLREPGGFKVTQHIYERPCASHCISEAISQNALGEPALCALWGTALGRCWALGMLDPRPFLPSLLGGLK